MKIRRLVEAITKLEDTRTDEFYTTSVRDFVNWLQNCKGQCRFLYMPKESVGNELADAPNDFFLMGDAYGCNHEQLLGDYALHTDDLAFQKFVMYDDLLKKGDILYLPKQAVYSAAGETLDYFCFNQKTSIAARFASKAELEKDNVMQSAKADGYAFEFKYMFGNIYVMFDDAFENSRLFKLLEPEFIEKVKLN